MSFKKIKIQVLLTTLIALPWILIGCGEQESPSAPAVYWQNGKCRSAVDHEDVDSSACANIGEYFIDRGQCVERQSDRVVSMNQCRNYSQYYWSQGDCFSKNTHQEVSIDFCFDPEKPYQSRQYNISNGYQQGNRYYYPSYLYY